MALITGSNVIGTVWTPAATGTIIAQATGGQAVLERRNVTGAPWAEAGRMHNSAVTVVHSVAGAEYRFLGLDAGVQVRADQ